MPAAATPSRNTDFAAAAMPINMRTVKSATTPRRRGFPLPRRLARSSEVVISVLQEYLAIPVVDARRIMLVRVTANVGIRCVRAARQVTVARQAFTRVNGDLRFIRTEYALLASLQLSAQSIFKISHTAFHIIGEERGDCVGGGR